MYVYGRVPLLFTWNCHNIFNQLCAVLCLVAQSCLTLCDTMDCSPPGSSVLRGSPGYTRIQNEQFINEKKKKNRGHTPNHWNTFICCFIFLIFQKNIFYNSKILKSLFPKKKSEVWREERDETATVSGCEEAFPINLLLPRSFQNFLMPPNAVVLFWW